MFVELEFWARKIERQGRVEVFLLDGGGFREVLLTTAATSRFRARLGSLYSRMVPSFFFFFPRHAVLASGRFDNNVKEIFPCMLFVCLVSVTFTPTTVGLCVRVFVFFFGHFFFC